ncbi:hypothetical protein M8C21_027263 [Ambrosia artemisiifolia]|uniref:sucrose synthase n=1 Tax=Ambrosia artemisiifolia TaxID=4212 RepID=A0AAD5CD62_AMBAR|nr:hypothetical protein M8C21_027263 [Ambrosia artemisiifolia]
MSMPDLAVTGRRLLYLHTNISTKKTHKLRRKIGEGKNRNGDVYTDRLKSAAHQFNQALSIDPLLWVAYEELCKFGSNVFYPKFNIASPGADQTVCLPITQIEKRFTRFQPAIKELLFSKVENEEHIGYFEDKNKPIIFSMAPLDTVKNITGLIEWFGQNKRLKSLVNLIVVAGFFDPTKSKDREEIVEIKKMHLFIEKYQLKGQIRWIAAQTDKSRNSELYRFIAGSKGAFVQPTLHEVFGLMVIEAMNCGFPTFVTNQGGPAEIIVDGVSGFQIDPNHGDEFSNKIADFFQKFKEDLGCWNIISKGGLKRIYEW